MRTLREQETIHPIQPTGQEVLGFNMTRNTTPMTQKAPLSFAQQRLWFLAQLEPDSPAYNILTATQIEGPLDTAALERSLMEMSRRHETLRTTFAAEDATPVQIIHPPTDFKLQQLDFTTVSEEQREKEARRLMRAEAACPFDLVRG